MAWKGVRVPGMLLCLVLVASFASAMAAANSEYYARNSLMIIEQYDATSMSTNGTNNTFNSNDYSDASNVPHIAGLYIWSNIAATFRDFLLSRTGNWSAIFADNANFASEAVSVLEVS